MHCNKVLVNGLGLSLPRKSVSTWPYMLTGTLNHKTTTTFLGIRWLLLGLAVNDCYMYPWWKLRLLWVFSMHNKSKLFTSGPGCEFLPVIWTKARSLPLVFDWFLFSTKARSPPLLCAVNLLQEESNNTTSGVGCEWFHADKCKSSSSGNSSEFLLETTKQKLTGLGYQWL